MDLTHGGNTPRFMRRGFSRANPQTTRARWDEGIAEAEIAAAYDAHGRRCYALALTILRDQQGAQEVVEGVFKALMRLRVRGETANPLNVWLITSTHRRAAALRRSWPPETVEAATCEIETNWTITDSGRDNAVTGRVRKALAALSNSDREVITLAVFGGLSQAEIAQHLDIPLKVVKSRHLQGMRLLSSLLATL